MRFLPLAVTLLALAGFLAGYTGSIPKKPEYHANLNTLYSSTIAPKMTQTATNLRMVVTNPTDQLAELDTLMSVAVLRVDEITSKFTAMILHLAMACRFGTILTTTRYQPKDTYRVTGMRISFKSSD